MRHVLTVALITLGSASPAWAAAETYQIEKTHADLLFSIDHAGFTQKHGSFREFDATLQYDPARPEHSKVEVTVQSMLNSIDRSERD